MLVTVCENTREYVNLKQVVIECKAKLDELSVGQDASIDQRLADLAKSHTSAMNQLNQVDSDDDFQAGSGIGDEADSSNVYERKQRVGEPAQEEATDEVEEVDMQQAPVKRPLPSSPLLPPLDIGANHTTEEIMGQLLSLNVAKKGKLTPRDGGGSE